MKRRTLADRVLANVSPEPNTGCWLWTGPMTPTGYGVLVPSTAHRQSWRAFRGEPAADLQVCHKCTQRSCVNPDHLRLGTRASNMRESRATRLTEADAAEIRNLRRSGMTQIEIGKRFGVSQPHVGRICLGRQWRADP